MTTVRPRRPMFAAVLLPALLAAAPAETQGGAWSMSVDTDPIDDSKSATAVLAGTADDGSRAHLFVHCNTETALFAGISWEDFYGRGGRRVLWSDDMARTPVTYRFPPAKARTDSSFNVPALALDHARLNRLAPLPTVASTIFGEDPIALLRKLVESERLVARAPLTTLYGQVKITVEFDLTDTRATIGKLAAICGLGLDQKERQTENT